MRVTVRDLARFKQEGRKFVMLTAYDHLTAGIVDEAGVPVILVGDSLAQVMLGYETTLPVTMEEMLHHTRAVARGAGGAMVVADMPFGSYQASLDEGFASAVRFLKEAGAHAVKLEGAQVELTHRLVDHGIPVMAHLGLTPQSVHALGGYRVQGRSREAAERLMSDAHSMEKAGAFSLVLEAIPAPVAAEITRSVAIPTIGIGAGAGCDAQVLVITDLLGLGSGDPPKFVKRYANLRPAAVDAITRFSQQVQAGTFPDDGHTYR
ncbi:MAG: 3-methyl-2-oxobutanoate hydroxymethyltransferase [Actinomycetota bacterium]